MDLHATALQTLRQADAHASRAAEQVVREPGAAEGYVGLHLAEREAEAGARLVAAADRMHGTLLDVLA